MKPTEMRCPCSAENMVSALFVFLNYTINAMKDLEKYEFTA